MISLPWRIKSEDGEYNQIDKEGSTEKHPGKLHLEVLQALDAETDWLPKVVHQFHLQIVQNRLEQALKHFS